MKIGDSFGRDGTFWIALQVTPEENKGFRWLKVLAMWEGRAPRPNWAHEPRTFLIGRIAKSPEESGYNW